MMDKMTGKTAVLMLVLAVISASGCIVGYECKDVGCEDTCSGDTRLYDGLCSGGRCMYFSENCEFGCSGGYCMLQPPHLAVSENPQKHGTFTLTILGSEVETGERDKYTFYARVANEGPGAIFSITRASILSSESGIMHSTSGFSWSDLIEEGQEKDIAFAIRDVPASRREQNMTLLVVSNQGYYRYPSHFEP
jgi:hypothetical protein